MQELLTLKEIARQLGVPESNLRYYKNKISDFLPSVGKGRRRRYLPEAIDVFQRCIDLVQEGMTLDRVYKYLSQEQPAGALSLAGQSQQELVEKIAGKVGELIKQEPGAGDTSPAADTSLLDDKLDSISERIESIRRELERTETERKGQGEALLETKLKCDRLEKSLEASGKENEAKTAEILELQRQLQEKERVVQLQREQLLEARNQRLNIVEELKSLRELLQ